MMQYPMTFELFDHPNYPKHPIFYKLPLKGRGKGHVAHSYPHDASCSAIISCRRVSVRPSVTSRCSTEMAKRSITQTTPTIVQGL